MAADCAVCGEPATVSGACPHCGAACCGDHRPPSAHDCTGTTAGTTGGWRPDLDGASVDPPERSPASLLRPGVGLGVVTLLVVVAAVGAVAYVGPPDDGLDAGTVETGIEAATVSERRAAGVGAVETDPDLAAVARAHSRDMRDRGYVDHVDPGGVGPQDRAEAAGLDCFVGENIYQTPRGALADSERALADQVVRGWLGSAGHRETLLSERYDRQGVGVAVGEDAVYVTQLFC
ncbi:hypothetical protein BRD05_04015 [Halobacteriales archaeon QS_9_70_65]|nr:MAG: hypothetical protein BRD05_04015 [Halobacteriales archaeon QS_9_70_65]